jgi:CheY-like chemotaxis protein
MEAIGQLAGGIAHDFNNILTAIIGYASILQMKIPSGSALNETAKHILSAAERGSSLTQGLLAFSRKQDTNLSSINLNEIITRIDKLLLRLIGEDIQLISLLDEERIPVMVDSVQIEQVLMNLVTNSRDAMPNGGTIFIKTETVRLDDEFISEQGFGIPGHYALLSVTDSGEGMDEDTIKRIFDPFYTTKETGKGTGLGLSIIYGIIKKHNGFITCHSSLGQGATFSIYLPISTSVSETASSPENAEIVSGSGEMILLAEDDESMRTLYKELLEEFGYSIIAAKDGIDALEKFRSHTSSIGLAILDVVMPGMGGVELYKSMHALKPDIRILFCTGYSADSIEKEISDDPRLHFLAKPYMPKELLMKIREIVENDF